MEFENQKIKEDMQTEEETQEITKKPWWGTDVPKPVLLYVLILIVLPVTIIFTIVLWPLVIVGIVFLLISRVWGVAAALFVIFLIVRMFLILFKQ